MKTIEGPFSLVNERDRERGEGRISIRNPRVG